MALGALAGDVIPAYPNFVRLRVAAEISSRYDDDDAVCDRILDCLHERIGRRWFVDRVAKRQIDDAEVQAAAIGDDEINRVDDVARIASASAVEHLHLDELHRRRDTLINMVGSTAMAGQEARHVGAMSEVVVLAPLLHIVGHVVEGDPAQIAVSRRDARVNHCHADIFAFVRRRQRPVLSFQPQQAFRSEQCVIAKIKILGEAAHDRIRRYTQDIRIRGNGAKQRCWQLHGQQIWRRHARRFEPGCSRCAETRSVAAACTRIRARTGSVPGCSTA